jgi:hypothetical protein
MGIVGATGGAMTIAAGVESQPLLTTLRATPTLATPNRDLRCKRGMIDY